MNQIRTQQVLHVLNSNRDLQNNTGNDSIADVEKAAPLKYLGSFLRTLEIFLISR